MDTLYNFRCTYKLGESAECGVFNRHYLHTTKKHDIKILFTKERLKASRERDFQKASERLS